MDLSPAGPGEFVLPIGRALELVDAFVRGALPSDLGTWVAVWKTLSTAADGPGCLTLQLLAEATMPDRRSGAHPSGRAGPGPLPHWPPVERT